MNPAEKKPSNRDQYQQHGQQHRKPPLNKFLLGNLYHHLLMNGRLPENLDNINPK
jgi:hypothetical protein